MKRAIVVLLALSCAACGAITKEDVKSIVDLSDTACVLLDKTVEDKTTDQVCATQEELKPYVDKILSARKMAAGVAGATPEEPAKTECPACPSCEAPKAEEKPKEPEVKPEEPAKK